MTIHPGSTLATMAGCIGVAVLAIPATAQPGRDAISLSPHRAIYDITLERASPGSGIAAMTGRMVYELTGSECEGYAQNMRFVTRTTEQNGVAQVNDLRTSTWEEAKGGRLRFNLQQFRDEKLAEQTQGDADRGDADGPISVQLSEPNKKDLKIRPDVYFPMQHSRGLLAAAKRGDRFFAVPLYDGSDQGEKVYHTTSYIGDRLDPGSKDLPQDLVSKNGLDTRPAWPIAISYFEPGSESRDAVPAYELSFRFFDNGISTRILIDYGDFAIRGALKELELLPVTKCEGQ